MIRHEKGKFVLYNKAGSKKLGTHDSYDKALKQERAIKMSLRQKLASDVNAAVRAKTARTMGLLDWDPAPRPMPVGLNDAQGYVDAAGEGLITRDGNSMNMDMDVLGNMLAAEGRRLKQERLRGTAEDHRDLGQRVGDEARSSLAYDIDPTMAGAGVAAAGGLGAIGLMKLLARLRGR